MATTADKRSRERRTRDRKSGLHEGDRPDNAPAVAERTLPHNIDAERALLGAILIHNDAYLQATKHVAARDFFRDVHRRIFEGIATLLDRPGGSCDLVTLREELTRRGDIEEVGIGYVASLTDGVPRSMNVSYYAQIVREKARLREIIYTSNKLTASAYEAEETADNLLNQADRAIIDLRHGHSAGRLLSVKASHERLLEELEYRVAHKGQLTGVPTGFQSIDDMTMGWQPTDMIIIGARPSIGKTTFVLNSAVAAARSMRPTGEARRVAIFSLEMRRLQLELRLLSSLSGVPLTTIMGGWVTDEQWGPLTHAMGELAELDIIIDDRASRTVWDIRGDCRRLIAEGGLDLVVIDYVQLMQGEDEKARRYETVTDISRKVKLMAGDLALPVILLSQLSRASEDRPDPRPKLSDLRESGALEQDADLVCFLHRKHHRESGTTNFIIDKGRNIEGGTVNLTLYRELTKFEDGGEDPPPPPPKEKKEQDEHARTRAFLARNRKHR